MEAKQFVYTNVEEKDSPHRRRGYQSWLFPREDFTDELRRLVEGHLNQLDWDTHEESAERFLSTPLTSGFHLIARSRSLSGVDRFNRQGRFHAHGLILSEKDFEKLHCDPFRVIDAVAFQAGPDEVIARPDWERIKKDADLGLLSFEPAADRPVGAAPLEVIGWLVDLALSADKKPNPRTARPVQFLAVPQPPAEVLALARAVVHALPAKFRKGVSFDTLRPLRHPHTAHLSGAMSADWLRRWTTASKYAIAEPGKPLPLPQPPSPWRELSEAWATKPELDRRERKYSWRLLEWLGDADANVPIDPSKVPATSVEIVGRYGKPEAMWAAKVGAVVDAALAGLTDPTFAFLRTQATEHIGPWSLEGLKRLHAGIANEFVGQRLTEKLQAEPPLRLTADALRQLLDWSESRNGAAAVVGRFLVNYFDATATVPLTNASINAIHKWTQSHTGRAIEQLSLVLYRWHPREQVLDKAIAELRDPNATPVRTWFLNWCRKSLPDDAFSTPGLKARTDHILSAPLESDLSALARETRLGQAVHEAGNRSLRESGSEEGVYSWQVGLQAVIALTARVPGIHREFVSWAGQLAEQNVDVARWLLKFAGPQWQQAARLTALADDSRQSLAEGFGYPVADNALPFYLGVEIDCPEVGAARAELAEIAFGTETGFRALRDSGAFPHSEDPPHDYPDPKARAKAKKRRTAIGRLTAWGAVESAFEQRDAKKLTALFVRYPKTFYLAAEEYLFGRVSAAFVTFKRLPVRQSVFVGIMPRVSGPSSALIPLLRGLLESVVGLRAINDDAPPPTGDTPPPGLRDNDESSDEDEDEGEDEGEIADEDAAVPHCEPKLRWLIARLCHTPVAGA